MKTDEDPTNLWY